MAEEIICPTCNSPNDAFAQECADCGAALEAAPEPELADAPETEFEIEEVLDVADADDFSEGYGFAGEETDASDHDADLYELEVEERDNTDFDYPDNDELAADGGMALDAISQVDAYGGDEDAPDEFGYELSEEEGDVAMGTELTEPEEEHEGESDVEKAARPAELDAILNPGQVEREPIVALPVPGNYRGPASLRVFTNGEQRAELAVDTACTVLGRPTTSDDTEDFELEASADADFPFDDELEEEPIFDLDELSEPSDTLNLQNHAAEEEELDDLASESSEAAVAHAQDYEDPEPLEEGPLINLSQYGDAAKFALRHGYIFRQNKNYTLCVLTDKGTQLNDEMLELGSHRPLVHGDMIILGGEVALQFRAPAS